MKVYILVLVTYDYYRFQDNIAVYDNIKKCEDRAKIEDEDKPVYCYNDNYDENLDNREESHFCVQEHYCA